MKEAIKKFLEKIVNSEDVSQPISEEASQLLEEDFKEQVIDLWKYDFTTSYYHEGNIKDFKVLSSEKLEFVCLYKPYVEKSKFIEDNWDKVDKIIAILKDYGEELENGKDK